MLSLAKRVSCLVVKSLRARCDGGTIRTRTVLRTDDRRGKSSTPLPSVLTEDSRKEREVRKEATQSLYEEPIVCLLVWFW